MVPFLRWNPIRGRKLQAELERDIRISSSGGSGSSGGEGGGSGTSGSKAAGAVAREATDEKRSEDASVGGSPVRTGFDDEGGNSSSDEERTEYRNKMETMEKEEREAFERERKTQRQKEKNNLDYLGWENVSLFPACNSGAHW